MDDDVVADDDDDVVAAAVVVVLAIVTAELEGTNVEAPVGTQTESCVLLLSLKSPSTPLVGVAGASSRNKQRAWRM